MPRRCRRRHGFAGDDARGLGQDGSAGRVVGGGVGRLDGGRRCRCAAGRYRPHTQPSPAAVRDVRRGVSQVTAGKPSPGCARWPPGSPAPGVVSPRDGVPGSGTVFVYSGQGSQWAGMGRQLLADEPAFAAAVAELEPVFVEQVGFSLRQVLEAGEPVVGIDRIQPVLVGMQLALTELWRSYGVEPDAVIGHSMGEVTAAVVAGALSPADGLKVIATRSRLMSRLSGQGAMALLELDAAAAEKLIADYPDLTVAVYASPGQTVIAGPPEQVDAVIAVVDAQGRLARRVEVDVASHHPTIDPILPELRSALADLAPMTPKIPLISTVGQTNGVAPTFDADYWATNLRNPVRFSQAVAAAGANHSTFIEVTPHPLLTHAITESLEPLGPRGDIQVAATLYRDNPETITFHTHLATVRPPSAATAENVGGAERIVDIPPTPWLHSRYWVASSSAGRQVAGAHPLLGMHVEMPSGRDHVWQADVGTEVIPWLADHKVHGQPVMPATGFVEMALAAASEALGLPVQAVAVNRVEVEQMLRLDGRTEVTTQLVRGTADSVDDIRVEIHSRSANGNWSRHAVARAGVAQPETLPSAPRADESRLPPSRGGHGPVTRRPLRRVAPHGFAPRPGVRGVDPDRSQAGRFLGSRDRPARRGRSAPQLPDPSGDARRSAAVLGRGFARRIVGRLGRSHVSAGVGGERSGCSAMSAGAPDATPS